MDTLSAVPSIGAIMLAISLAKVPDDLKFAVKFAAVATHISKDEKEQILRFACEKKFLLEKELEDAFDNLEREVKNKCEAPQARKVV